MAASSGHAYQLPERRGGSSQPEVQQRQHISARRRPVRLTRDASLDTGGQVGRRRHGGRGEVLQERLHGRVTAGARGRGVLPRASRRAHETPRSMVRRSRSRPRWTWALTVPIGRSVMMQMSASDSSPKKRSVITSRYGSGSAATDLRRPSRRSASRASWPDRPRPAGSPSARHLAASSARPAVGSMQPGANSVASRCGPATHPVGRRRGSWPVSGGRARTSPAWRPRRPRFAPGSGSRSGTRWASQARQGFERRPRPPP